MPNEIDTGRRFAFLDENDIPVVASPVGIQMQTGLGSGIDAATPYLNQADRNALEYMLQRKRVSLDPTMERSLFGTYSGTGRLAVNANHAALDSARNVANTLSHELQHARQPWLGGTEKSIPTPLMTGDDPYYHKPREIEARLTSAYTENRPPNQYKAIQIDEKARAEQEAKEGLKRMREFFARQKEENARRIARRANREK